MAEKLRAFLIGAGGISAAWLNPLALRDDVEIIAVVDPLHANAEAKIAEFKLPARYFATLEAAFAALEADVILDCSIPGAHASNALAALAQGCHVLSEKPIAESVADVRKIIAAARTAGRIHAVIQNRRYLPEIIAYRDAVQHQIGRLTTLNADFYLGAHFGGFRDVMEHVLLLDMAIHSFDQARMISGCDPESVYCREWNPAGSWYRHGASAVALFTMTNGVVFTYRGSWCAEGCNTSWECDWRAVGTAGSVWWANGKVRGERVAATGGFISETRGFAKRLPKLELAGHAGCIDEFLRCVKTGGTPQTVCTDNVKSLAMVEAAIESANTHREVKIKK